MTHSHLSKRSVWGSAIAALHIAAAVFFSLDIGEAATVDPFARNSFTEAKLINGGFETGDLTGWKVSVPVDESQFPPARSNSVPPAPWLLPAGTVRVETSPFQRLIPPPDGDALLAVGTGDTWFKYGKTYDITASQTISLEKGEILSGLSSFYNGDFEAQDSAWVKIFDESGAEVQTLWNESSGQRPVASVPYLSNTPWTSWQWGVPVTSTYTLVLGATTFGDNRFASYGLYDAIQVKRVPDGSPIWLFVLTSAGMLWFWRGSVHKSTVISHRKSATI